MSEKLAKYIITTGNFDNQTNNIKDARKALKRHTAEMRSRFPNDNDTYAIYMLVEKSNA